MGVNGRHCANEIPTVEPIIHQSISTTNIDDKLVAVIVTISSGSSFDQLFKVVPQFAGEGKRVATYQASASSLPFIAAELNGSPMQRSTPLHQKLRRLLSDINTVPPDCVVFNWECCSNCCEAGFPRLANGEDGMVIDLVKTLLDKGFMVMFSDFSLKSLIADWREDVLGPNPFVRVSSFDSSFKLCFDPSELQSCASAQLQ